jgi:hypothetical protein
MGYMHALHALSVYACISCIAASERGRKNSGNFFFAGARTFFRSLDAAIFLFSRVARLPLGSAVIPAISTEERITLGAQLADGTRLRGQNVISHPPSSSTSPLVMKDGALLVLRPI